MQNFMLQNFLYFLADCEPCLDRFRILSPFFGGEFFNYSTRKRELHVSYTGHKKPPTWVSLLTYTLSLLEQNQLFGVCLF